MDFKQIDYLNEGNRKQKIVFQLLSSSGILPTLANFTPTLAGTIPIAVDTDKSDLDILCYWKDKNEFVRAVLSFEDELDFDLSVKKINNLETVVGRFVKEGFQIEIFGQNRPVQEQEAYRHMLIEHQILLEKGNSFREKVIALKKTGFKTEAAFTFLLNLKGDPFISIFDYKKQ